MRVRQLLKLLDKVHPKGNVDLYDAPSFFHKQKEVKLNSTYLRQEKGTNNLNSGSRLWEVTGRRVHWELVCEGNSTETKASTKTAGRWEAQPCSLQYPAWQGDLLRVAGPALAARRAVKDRISAWVILTCTRLLCRNILLNYDNCISALGKGCFLRSSSLVLVNKYNPSKLKWCHWCALEASLPECTSPRLCTTTQSKCSLRYFKGDVCAS